MGSGVESFVSFLLIPGVVSDDVQVLYFNCWGRGQFSCLTFAFDFFLFLFVYYYYYYFFSFVFVFAIFCLVDSFLVFLICIGCYVFSVVVFGGYF